MTDRYLEQQEWPLYVVPVLGAYRSCKSFLLNRCRTQKSLRASDTRCILTLRELLARFAGGRGHYTTAGTPEQIADLIEDWCTDGAADGFNYMPPVIPSLMNPFIDEVIPLLQKRGLFRTEYEGTTLRENLGLDRPKSRFFD